MLLLFAGSRIRSRSASNGRCCKGVRSTRICGKSMENLNKKEHCFWGEKLKLSENSFNEKVLSNFLIIKLLVTKAKRLTKISFKLLVEKYFKR